ncbi:hypothetical protein WMY93_028362 [Mugilogobius chulae]|uniref:Uncharacterized protein n=1 Tax=Mugilogobius chulae TaxID=88201 RepID=A0AAW0MN75_9GOBI
MDLMPHTEGDTSKLTEAIKKPRDLPLLDFTQRSRRGHREESVKGNREVERERRGREGGREGRDREEGEEKDKREREKEDRWKERGEKERGRKKEEMGEGGERVGKEWKEE